jgi:hypothetical protein
LSALRHDGVVDPWLGSGSSACPVGLDDSPLVKARRAHIDEFEQRRLLERGDHLFGIADPGEFRHDAPVPSGLHGDFTDAEGIRSALQDLPGRREISLSDGVCLRHLEQGLQAPAQVQAEPG